ncbi:MAG: serine hydrolase [Elusimicrobia bacterium]|nr:serine hydrolase [Elusimicrobiota bacterium]
MRHSDWRRIILLAAALAAPRLAAAAPSLSLEKVKAALPGLDRLAQRTLQDTGIPGMAIAVVYQDQTLYMKGFGVRAADAAAPVDADTVFQLASLSKPLASTVLAALVGEKVISWDDRVADLDPGFRLYDPWATRQVTLRDLFSHRSGLPEHAGDTLEDLGYDRSEVLRRLRFQPPASSLRAQYAYTNFGLTEAAVAAARAAGKSWEDLCAAKLYRPLGMESTSSRFKDFAAARNRALGHVLEGGKWVAKYTRDADAQSPAGGVSSSVRDMTSWLRLQLANGKFEGRQVIGAEALAETHRPQMLQAASKDPATERARSYGLGWNVDSDDQGLVRWSHSGAFSYGAATTVMLLPAEGLGIVVLTNAYPIGAAEAVAFSFLDLAQTGKVQKDWFGLFKQAFAAMMAPSERSAAYARAPASPSTALPAQAYTGTFHNDYYGDIEIAEEEGGLLLRQGPAQTGSALVHFDRDTFTYQPAGESAGALSGVIFRMGPDQKARSVLIEALDDDGLGTFTR